MDEIQRNEVEVSPAIRERKADMVRESIVMDGYAGLKKGLFAIFVVLLILSAIGAFAIFGYISKDYYRYREADLSLEDCERKIDEANMEAYSLLQTNQMVRAASREALSDEMKKVKEKIDQSLTDYETKVAEQKKDCEEEFEKVKRLYASMEREFILSYESRTNELEQMFVVRKRHLDEQINFFTAECERLRVEWLQYVANTGRIAMFRKQVKDLKAQNDNLQRQIGQCSRDIVVTSTNLAEQIRLCGIAEGNKVKAEVEFERISQQIESLRDKEVNASRLADKEESRLKKIESGAESRKVNAEKELQQAKAIEQESLKRRQAAMVSETDIEQFMRDRTERSAALGRLNESIVTGSNRLARIDSQLKNKEKEEADIERRKQELRLLEDQQIPAARGKLAALREEIARLTARTNDLSGTKFETEVK